VLAVRPLYSVLATDEVATGLMLRFIKQLLQILLPHRRQTVRTMTARSIAGGKQHETAFLYPFDLPLCNSQFRRIDKIIGGVYEHYGRNDFFELSRRIIIPRSVESEKEIIRIMSSDKTPGELLRASVGRIARGESFLHL
jgi:hypothetical protein